MATELISGRIRALFRREAVRFVKREIDDLWQAEGFMPGLIKVIVTSERRMLWAEYEASVDFTDASHVARYCRVIQSALLSADETLLEDARRILPVDGWAIGPNMAVTPTSTVLPLHGLANLTDPSGVEEAFERIHLLLDVDPPGAVGACKELTESICRSVLVQRGEKAEKDESLQSLAKRTQTLLGLHPGGVLDKTTPTGAATTKILGGLSSIAVGLAELRNLGGGGHGRATKSSLGPRHARLAYNGARTFAEVVLDTLGDTKAPWQRNGAA